MDQSHSDLMCGNANCPNSRTKLGPVERARSIFRAMYKGSVTTSVMAGSDSWRSPKKKGERYRPFFGT